MKTQRPHACHECGKVFARRSNVNTYMSSAYGKKRHTCDICGPVYAYANKVRLAVTKEHTQPEEAKLGHWII